MLKVLFTCGGTGGHINPALAIADTIKANIPDAKIEFVGTPWGKENDLVPRENYTLHKVKMTGLRRSLSLSNIKTAYYMITAPRAAKKIILGFEPDIVIGTGGYASYPTVSAATKLGIPTMMHESNALPGKAIKMLSDKVDKILINFDQTKELLGDCRADVVRVGNPTRSAFGTLDRESARRKLGIDRKYRIMIVSAGGSGGAEGINRAVVEMMRENISRCPEIYMVHAAGSRDYKETKRLFDSYGLCKYPNLKLCEYIYDMPLQMSAADIVVSRAGAMTLSEISMLGRASVIIPSPYVADNHQFKNADALCRENAAMMIEEKDLSADTLFRKIEMLAFNDELRRSYEREVKKFSVADANERIYREICELVEKR